MSLRGRRWRQWKVAISILVVAGCAGASILWFQWRRVELPEAVSREEYRSAERRFREIYDQEPTRLDALSLLAESAVVDERLETAVACFREIPSDHAQYGPSARLQEGQVLVRLNRARQAEQSLREFLSLAFSGQAAVSRRDVIVASDWLTYVLSVELRLEDLKAVLAKMHTHGLTDVFDSKQYYFPNLLIMNSPAGRKRLRDFLAEDPRNRVLRVAMGRYRTAQGRIEEARAVLADLHREYPEDLRCAAALLECHFESGDWERFRRVAETLPQYRRGEPWLLTRMRGEWALRQERWNEAVRHFSRALQGDPAYLACHMGLARAYRELGETEKREKALDRVSVLAEVRVNLINVTEKDPEPSRDLAQACEKIGLKDAAKTFRGHARRIAQRRQQQATVTSR